MAAVAVVAAMRVAAVILLAVLRADADEKIKRSNAHVDGIIDEMRYREIREEHIMCSSVFNENGERK